MIVTNRYMQCGTWWSLFARNWQGLEIWYRYISLANQSIDNHGISPRLESVSKCRSWAWWGTSETNFIICFRTSISKFWIVSSWIHSEKVLPILTNCCQWIISYHDLNCPVTDMSSSDSPTPGDSVDVYMWPFYRMYLCTWYNVNIWTACKTYARRVPRKEWFHPSVRDVVLWNCVCTRTSCAIQSSERIQKAGGLSSRTQQMQRVSWKTCCKAQPRLGLLFLA